VPATEAVSSAPEAAPARAECYLVSGA